MQADGFVVLLLFGAPALIISLLLSIVGIWKRWLPAIIISGVWSIPATYYLSVGSRLPIYLTAVFVFGAAFAVHKEKIRTAWMLLIPLFFWAVWMTVFTVNNMLSG